jgi:hypothetical protein
MKKKILTIGGIVLFASLVVLSVVFIVKSVGLKKEFNDVYDRNSELFSRNVELAKEIDEMKKKLEDAELFGSRLSEFAEFQLSVSASTEKMLAEIDKIINEYDALVRGYCLISEKDNAYFYSTYGNLSGRYGKIIKEYNNLIESIEKN